MNKDRASVLCLWMKDCSDDILVISIVVILFFFCHTLLGARRLGCKTPTNASVLRLCQTIGLLKK